MRAHTANHTLLWGSNHILQCRLHGCLCNIPILFALRIRTPVVAGGGQGRFPAAAVPFLVIVVDHMLTVHHVKSPGDSTLQLAYRRWPTELLLLSQHFCGGVAAAEAQRRNQAATAHRKLTQLFVSQSIFA